MTDEEYELLASGAKNSAEVLAVVNALAQMEPGEYVDEQLLQTSLRVLERMRTVYERLGSSLDLTDEALAAKQWLVEGCADALWRLRQAVVARSLPGGN